VEVFIDHGSCSASFTITAAAATVSLLITINQDRYYLWCHFSVLVSGVDNDDVASLGSLNDYPFWKGLIYWGRHLLQVDVSSYRISNKEGDLRVQCCLKTLMLLCSRLGF